MYIYATGLIITVDGKQHKLNFLPHLPGIIVTLLYLTTKVPLLPLGFFMFFVGGDGHKHRVQWVKLFEQKSVYVYRNKILKMIGIGVAISLVMLVLFVFVLYLIMINGT